jgi:hypothetical protein
MMMTIAVRQLHCHARAVGSVLHYRYHHHHHHHHEEIAAVPAAHNDDDDDHVEAYPFDRMAVQVAPPQNDTDARIGTAAVVVPWPRLRPSGPTTARWLGARGSPPPPPMLRQQPPCGQRNGGRCGGSGQQHHRVLQDTMYQWSNRCHGCTVEQQHHGALAFASHQVLNHQPKELMEMENPCFASRKRPKL